MRNYNSNFLTINEQDNKEPKYVIEVSFDDANTDTIILTSHNDCAVPANSTVFYGVLKHISGTSQELNPIKANSTIGNLNFTVVDLLGELTKKMHDKLVPAPDIIGDGLRRKRVQLSIGFAGLAWADYEIPSGGTQIIDDLSYSMEGGIYYFKCSDVQRSIRKTICDVKITNLLYSINETQTAIAVASTTDFKTVFHGPSYSDSPNEYVGYIEFEKETIAWRKKLTTSIAHSGTDISFSGNTINSTIIDLSVYGDKQQIMISGSVSNDGPLNIVGAPTANSITVAEQLINESAGANITIKADVQFYDCTRGALNTAAIPHEIKENTDISRRTKIKEVIYVQLPAVKALYAFLTGTLVGDSATLPDHWHLNIAPEYIQTSAFIGIGNDWWDVDDDLAGVPFNLQYQSKVDGKQFIEKELLLLLGAFMPVTANGELSLRRMTYVGVDSPFDHILDKTNITRISKLHHDYHSVYNKFLLKWNWNHIEKEFTREEFLTDFNSINPHHDSNIYEMAFKGMHGATYTKARAHRRRDSVRDRYIGPPERITVTCSPEMNKVEIGDIVRLQLDNLQDFVDGGSINRSFEVQKVAIDWITGNVSLTLFGSTQKPTLLRTLESTTVIPNANYTSKGVDISTVTNGSNVAGTWVINSDSVLYGSGRMGDESYSVGTVSVVNGSKIITGTGTTWGNLTSTNIEILGVQYEIDSIDSNTQITLLDAYIGATNSAASYKLHGAIYYWDGDIEVASGKTLFVHDNVRIRYKGEIIINGSINGIGLGRKGTGPNLPGEIGYIGTTKAMGGVGGSISFEKQVTEGINKSLPVLNVEYDGNDVVGLDLIDMRPTSGGGGGGSSDYINNSGTTLGGSGGNGGSALVLEGRGVNVGVSGSIDLSGADGKSGALVSSNFIKLFSGSGAGGAGGPLIIILDGSYATTADVYSHFISNLGNSPLLGQKAPSIVYPYIRQGGPWHSYFEGFSGESQKSGAYHEIVLVDYVSPVVDVPPIAENPTAINLSEGVASKQSLNLAAIEVSVTPPIGSESYYSSAIYARESGKTAWEKVGTVVGTEEIVVQVPNYISTYEFKAAPISISGIESDSFISNSIPLTSASLGASFTTGGHIKAGQTAYDTGAGFFLGEDAGAWKFSIGNSSGDKFLWDGVNLSITGTITATSGTFTGTVNANAGNIGGWNVASGDLSAGGLILDSANTRIRASNGANYTEQSPNGFKAVDSVLGTTVDIPTNGNPPIFSSGVIKETEYQLYTSSAIKTSTDPATSGGTLIDSSGIQLFNSGGARTAFLDAVNSNHEFTGSITIAPGSTGVSNLSDAGALATLNAADWSTQVIGTGKPSNNADVTALNTAADTYAVNGRASADVESDAAAGATYTGDSVEIQGGLLPNWALNIIDSAGKPAGIRGVESVADRTGIDFGDSSKTWIRISHLTDVNVAYGFPAIPIDDQQQYRVTIRHRADIQNTTGLYLRFNELASALPSGKTHIGLVGEPMVAARTGLKGLVGDGPFPPATWTEVTYTYTPTAGTQWASFSMYNWHATTVNYDVDAVMITPIAKTADQVAETGARKWAGESGADVTASNTAAAIAGQGALATQNTADYTSQVSGTKPPSDADNTQTGLQAGVTITTGGLDIGGNDAKIRIGNAIGYLNGDGVFSGREGGITKFSVGDPANEKYLAFDGSDVVLGRDTKIVGADAWNNTSGYRRFSFPDITYTTNTITSGVSVSNVDEYLDVTVPSSGGEEEIYKSIGYGTPNGAWGKEHGFKFSMYLTSGFDTNLTGKTSYIGIGRVGTAPSNNFIGFKIIDDNIFGYSIKNGVDALTALSFTFSAPTTINFKLFHKQNSIDFYINDILKGTLTNTAYIPWLTSSGYPHFMAYLNFGGSTATPDYAVYRFSEFIYYQGE